MGAWFRIWEWKARNNVDASAMLDIWGARRCPQKYLSLMDLMSGPVTIMLSAAKAVRQGMGK